MHHRVARVAAALLATAGLSTAVIAGGAPAAGAATSSSITFASSTGTNPNFDPGQGSINMNYFLAPVYDTLLRESTTATFSADLATKWGYTNPKTFVMTLRKGVKFTDGTPFNAAAVKANLLNVKNSNGALSSQLSALKSVTIVNDYEVRLNLSQAYPSLPTVLASVSGMMASPKVLGTKSLATTPDGTGPYTLDTSATVVDDTYVYTKRSDYWNSSAYPAQQVTVKIMTASAELNALQSGQLQAGEFGDANSIARIKQQNIAFTGGPYNVWTLFLLDRNGTKVPALKSQLVREALNYAVNRKAMVKAVQLGYGKPTTQLLKPGDKGYSAALDNAYPYNPKKAKKLLKQAGYAKGFTLPALNVSLGDTFMSALASYYKAIGVTLKITDVPLSNWISDMVGGKYPAAFLPYGVVDSYYDFGQLATPTAGFNPFHSSDSTVNTLYKQAAGATGAKQTSLLGKLNAELVHQAWFVPVFSDTFGIAYTSAVKGIKWVDLRPPLFYKWTPAS